MSLTLDQLVWEQLFGGTIDQTGNFMNSGGFVQPRNMTLFSSDIKCAWLVVSIMKKNNFKLYLADCITEDDNYMCFFMHGTKRRTGSAPRKFLEGPNVPELICRAALQAIKSLTRRYKKKP